MTRILLPLFLCFALMHCNDDCDADLNFQVDETQLALDIAEIDAYLEQNDIQAMEHPSGLRYVIEREGDGRFPESCDEVVVTYEGFLLTDDDDPFDFTANFTSFNLDGGLISGWKIGVPLINEGGRIRLFIPSVYGYGESGNGSVIPPNSNLIFTVTLFDARR